MMRNGARMVMLLAVLLACGRQPPAQTKRPALLAFVASSTAEVMSSVAREFQSHTGTPVEISAGSSLVLARQIEAGAPADLLFAAGADPVERLIDLGLASPRDRVDLLTNRLVLAVSQGTDLHATVAADLLAPRVTRIAIGDPDTAPAGRYAREALQFFGLWDSLRPRLVTAPDVRAALAYMETGAAEAAIVYATDARSRPSVRTGFIFPEESHEPIVYPAIVPSRAPQREEALALLRFLQSQTARRLFSDAGFTSLVTEPGAAAGNSG